MIQHFVAAQRPRARVGLIETTQQHVADFDAVAEQAVVAQGIVGDVITSVGGLVAGIGGTRDGIVAVGRYASRATDSCLARFHAVTEQTIIALGVIGNVIAGVGGLVAGIGRTRDGVVAIRRRAIYATDPDLTAFRPVAEQAVVAQGIVGDVITGIGGFVAGVCRACDGVVTIRRGTIHAADADLTAFRPVAEQTIVTQRIVGGVVAGIGGFVAGIRRTCDGVVAVGRYASRATDSCLAR
ncbi:MAG: hypothetical protein ACE5FI_17060, partial [Anaerolineales bacterium]